MSGGDVYSVHAICAVCCVLRLRLKRQEADLQARNRELVALKERVETMTDAAREVRGTRPGRHHSATGAIRMHT